MRQGRRIDQPVKKLTLPDGFVFSFAMSFTTAATHSA